MDNLPPPPVPPDANCRRISKMPLDVTRILHSDLVRTASAEAFRAAFLLWVESWHEVPAGSLPADDAQLAVMSRAGAAWLEVRDVALRGWKRHDDGRLYHAVMVEAVRASLAWQRAKDRERTATAARVRRWRAVKALRRAAGVVVPLRDASRNALHDPSPGNALRDRHVTVLEEESESLISSESVPRARESNARPHHDGSATGAGGDVEAKVTTDLVAALMRRGLGPTRAVQVAHAARDPAHPDHESAVRLCENSGAIARPQNRPVQRDGPAATSDTSAGRESLP